MDLNKKTTVGGQQYVRGNDANFDRVLNTPNTTNANATVLNGITLQNKKLDNIVIGRETVNRKDGTSEEAVRYAGEAVDGFSLETEAATLGLQQYNVTNGIDVTSTDNTKNGLVVIKKAAAGNTNFTVTGQENDSEAKGKVNAVTGSKLNTRIFGNKSLDVTNAAAQNSVRFVAATNAAGNLVIVNDAPTATNPLVGDKNKSSFKTIKLDDVQYGRVTSNIDKLPKTVDGTTYYQSPISAAADRNSAGTVGKKTVDTYFYRGTNETTIAQMDALKAKGGTVSYAGHALMYGIDNSYHGNLGDPNSNSFGDADRAVEGKGNFVQANVNMADRTIAGNIFNVWEVQPGAAGSAQVTKQDNLVNFKGKIFGNTAKGESQLAYGTDKTEGTFKGTFFGPNADELGGAVNSVTTPYGAPAWGGVFGAEKVVTPKLTPPGGNANQTE